MSAEAMVPYLFSKSNGSLTSVTRKYFASAEYFSPRQAQRQGSP